MRCSRREFFTRFSQSVVADVCDSLHAFRGLIAPQLVTRGAEAGKTPRREWLRPPGALPEARFLETCTRCTDCQTACPYDAIRRLGPEFGDAAGTPAIIPAESPCYLCEDIPCIAACEPGALRTTPRDEVQMGLAIVDESSCYQAKGQPCDYCVARCPIGQSAITFDDRRIPVVNSDGCTGCGVCGYLCPPSAIRISAEDLLDEAI